MRAFATRVPMSTQCPVHTIRVLEINVIWERKEHDVFKGGFLHIADSILFSECLILSQHLPYMDDCGVGSESVLGR